MEKVKSELSSIDPRDNTVFCRISKCNFCPGSLCLVRMLKIFYTNNNDFHHLGRSQMCAGACYYFSPSKPHSGTLCSEKPVWDPESSSYGIFIKSEGVWICCGVESPLYQCIKLSLVIKGRGLGSVVFVTCIHTLGPLESLCVEKNS